MTAEVVFQVNSGGSGFTASPTVGDYNPGNFEEIDRAIRHMPAVVAYLEKKANEMLGLIEKSNDFHVIVSTSGEQRARAYVAPANGGGIHLEAADSVMLKAAAAMQGR
jgi:hypothetical protein